MRKTLFKKLLTVTTIAAMTLSLFGCSGDKNSNKGSSGLSNVPSVESLVTNIYDAEEVKSGRMEADLKAEMSVYIEEMDTSFETEMAMKIQYTFDEDEHYSIGRIEAEVMGEAIEENMEEYTLKDGDVHYVYTKNESTNKWSLSVEEEPEVSDFFNMLKVDKSYYDKFKVLENTDSYEAVGTFSIDEIAKLLNTTSDEFFGDLPMEEDFDYDDMTVKLSLVFDKGTKLLESYSIKFSSIETEEFTLESMTLDIEIKDVNKATVEVPTDLEEYIEESFSDAMEDLEDDIDDPVSNDEDDKSNTSSNNNTREIKDYNDNTLCTISLPKGYEFDAEYQSDNLAFLKCYDGEYIIGNVSVYCYMNSYIEDYLDGSYTYNTDLYLKNEISKYKDIETKQGTVNIYQKEWSMYEELTSYDYYAILEIDDECVTIEVNGESLDKTNYTIEKILEDILN